ncbi:YMGG-like glycine zipper-containing protein [Ferruginibacter sp. HRS2-29]|uniref:YMGG-like glycine zipper-containing protein n=1 Tax=Ferruginibacter sp. HRS2-29 TaxID=2487334 RepID=UPI0020CC80B3|nr:YMGG-like glycine zipper-containing protein [Ferruginibacter sp. HRS2-29]MCP9752881.1 hypothetical protein [Ferruginibacter sp. HRS2-29]
MKRILLPLALLVTIFTACKTEQKKEVETSRQLLLTPDTASLYPSGAASDVAKDDEEDNTPKKTRAVAPKTKTIIRYVEKQTPAPVVAPVPTTETVVTPPVVATTTPEVITTPATTPTETATTAPAPVENKKKGISDAAKGAAIGGVGGAVAGAVIGKGGKGAIIGGVIGAAGGYIIGRAKDKKSGRIDYATN